MGTLEQIFRTGSLERDNFLSRVFGLFSEDVIRDWAANPSSPYEDLGRPHLRRPDEPFGHTLDFALRDRATGRVYVTEMKCELAFEGHRYLRLTRVQQLDHHRGVAFQKFLDLARDPAALPVTVQGKPTQVHGAILVWGAITPEGRDDVMAKTGMHDVLAVEDTLADLLEWRDERWHKRVGQLADWTHELFEWLASADNPG